MALQIIIDTTGRVEKGSVVVISAPDSSLAASARAAVFASVYVPGRVYGRPVRTKVLQTMTFEVF